MRRSRRNSRLKVPNVVSVLTLVIWGISIIFALVFTQGRKRLEVPLYVIPLGMLAHYFSSILYALGLLIKFFAKSVFDYAKRFHIPSGSKTTPEESKPEFVIEPAPVSDSPEKPARPKSQLQDRAKLKYQAMYGEKSYYELINVPDDVYFSSDGIPHIKGNNKKSRYAFVLSYEDCYLHKPPCRLAKGFWINISQLQELPNHRYIYDNCVYEPCPLCQPEFPDMSWYREYQRIRELKTRYGIK